MAIAAETAQRRPRGTHLPQGTRGTSGKISVRLGTEPNQEILHGISERGPRGTHPPQCRRGTSAQILIRPGTERNQEIVQGISEERTRGTQPQDTREIHSIQQSHDPISTKLQTDSFLRACRTATLTIDANAKGDARTRPQNSPPPPNDLYSNRILHRPNIDTTRNALDEQSAGHTAAEDAFSHAEP